MDPVTLAILAGLSAVTHSVADNAITESYEELKDVIKKKFGDKSELVKSIIQLENKPESNARRQLVQEEVGDSRADRDPEILQAAQSLLEHLRSDEDGEQIIQIAAGNYIAQADRGGTATIRILRRLPGDPTTDAPPPRGN
jgi:hypothetical protein